MKDQIQATIDICVKISSYNNLSDKYLRNLYFTLYVFIDQQIYAFPYQIINHNHQIKSNTTLLNYISPVVTFQPFTKVTLDELVIFKILVPINQIEQKKLACKFILYELVHQAQELIQQIYFQYESILGLSTLMPALFQKQKIAINAVIFSQLLSYRIGNQANLSQLQIDKMIRTCMIQYNKQKNKLKQHEKVQIKQMNQNLQEELQALKDKYKYRIFNNHFQVQKKNDYTCFIQKFMSEMSNILQINWKNIIQLISKESVQQKISSFYTTLKLQLKQNVYQKGKDNKQFVVEGLQMGKTGFHIQSVFRKQVSAFHKVEDIKNQKHYVVLVHGYGATSMVFYELQCLIRYFYPHLYIINSKINQNQTQDSLQDLGKRLAFQITQTMKNIDQKGDFALSFIAHSLGGLIVRSALPHLEVYRYSMKIFISLGSPHLGYLYHNSFLIKFGLSMYNKIKKSLSIRFLLMEHQDNYRLSSLYGLTSSQGLNWFENLIFYAAKRDYYVNPESALCQSNQIINQEFAKGKQNAKIWKQMLKNVGLLLENVGVEKYIVNFHQDSGQQNFTDEFLGRKDHISLSNNKNFLKCFLIAHSNLFQK